MFQNLVHNSAVRFEIWSRIGFFHFFPSVENIAKVVGVTEFVWSEHLKSIKFRLLFAFGGVIWTNVAIFMTAQSQIFEEKSWLQFTILPLFSEILMTFYSPFFCWELIPYVIGLNRFRSIYVIRLCEN